MLLKCMAMLLAAPAVWAAAMDPFTVAREVDRTGFVDWAALGWTPHLTPCQLVTERVPCSVETIVVAVPEQAIVLIHTQQTGQEVYLRYVREKGGKWGFSGGHEAMNFAYHRRHEVRKGEGRQFLVVSRQGMRGSGMSSEVEDWFDLTAREFSPVFSFAVRGHRSGLGRGGVGFEFSAIVLPAKQEMGVSLFITVFREAGMARENLGRIEVEADYRRGGMGAYEFAEAKLSLGGRRLSKAQVEELTDVDEGPSEATLKRLMKAW